MALAPAGDGGDPCAAVLEAGTARQLLMGHFLTGARRGRVYFLRFPGSLGFSVSLCSLGFLSCCWGCGPLGKRQRSRGAVLFPGSPNC